MWYKGDGTVDTLLKGFSTISVKAEKPNLARCGFSPKALQALDVVIAVRISIVRVARIVVSAVRRAIDPTRAARNSGAARRFRVAQIVVRSFVALSH